MLDKNIDEVKNKVISLLKKKYRNSEIKKEKLILLNKGKFANATVFRYCDEKIDLTIKDFSGSPWLIKNIFGRFAVNVEGKTLKKLEGNMSVTKQVKFLSPYTLSFAYIKGKSLKQCDNIKKDFFITLERNVRDMHEKEIVHLDLRNLGNIIMGENGYPYIIDFQSCISTKYVPKKLKKTLKKVDISGVYKCWENRCSEPLDEKRRKFLDSFKEIRKLWILKGYPLLRMIKKIKGKISLKKTF